VATRRNFTQEYKDQAVRLVLDSGRSIGEVAKHALSPMQPTDLRPVLHVQHLSQRREGSKFPDAGSSHRRNAWL
jgi:Transposase